MADKKEENRPNLDPSAQWQEMVTQWERASDQFFNQLMGTEQFSQAMNQVQQLQLEFQKGFRDAMSNYLLNMNMPSRDDVVQLGEDVRTMDERLARIEARLDQIAAGAGAEAKPKRKRPARTKRPPAKKSE